LFFDGGPGIAMIGIYAGIGPLLNLGNVPFYENPYSWNDKANVFFVSNPAGVGYSYAQNQEDLYNNDNSISEDLFRVIEQFYKGFPEYLPNPLFIGGNSYGGIYAPFLAFKIH
jgi:cathepsin A (carboxypeptidase C)